MKLQIEITHPSEVKSGTSQRTGKPYSIIEQKGMLTLPNGERRQTTLQLEAGNADLPPGLYEPKDDAVYIGGFGKIELSQRARNWRPVEAARAK